MAADHLQPGARPANTAARPDAAHITTTVPRTAGFSPLPGHSANAEPIADAAPPASLPERIAELSRQATALERMLRQVRGVLYAIFDDDMLTILPSEPAAQERHNMATLLLELLRDRLATADVGALQPDDDAPYLGSLSEALDALEGEVRHAAR